MNKTAIYPGTFDPITYGHLDLIKRALRIFNKVVVAVAEDNPKDCLFTLNERVAFIRKAASGLKEVEVDTFKGLVVDYVKKKSSCAIIRGIRMLSDFEYEFQMALTNRRLNRDIETIFLIPNESYSYISSRLIKETASLGADVDYFVPKFVAKALKEKMHDKDRSRGC